MPWHYSVCNANEILQEDESKIGSSELADPIRTKLIAGKIPHSFALTRDERTNALLDTDLAPHPGSGKAGPRSVSQTVC